MKTIFYNSKVAKWLTILGTTHTITIDFWIFTELPKEKVKQSLINHELTHVQQFQNLMFVGFFIFAAFLFLGIGTWWTFLLCSHLFYVWYCVEWFIRFIIALCDGHRADAWRIAYKGLAFEKEADAMEYITSDNERRNFGFFKYY